MLLICLFDMPYGYYQFVRLAGTIFFAFLAYEEYEEKGKTIFFFIWIIAAILFNPFLKVSLGRVIWNIVDVVMAFLLIHSIYNLKK